MVVVVRFSWLTASADTNLGSNYVNNSPGGMGINDLPVSNNTSDDPVDDPPVFDDPIDDDPVDDSPVDNTPPDNCPTNNTPDDGEDTGQDGCCTGSMDDDDDGNGGLREREHDSPMQGMVAATTVSDTGVMFKQGAIWLAPRDASQPLRGPDWSSGNMYTSDPGIRSGLTNMNGYGWFGKANPFVRIDGTTYEVFLHNTSAFTYAQSGSTYTGPPQARATLEEIAGGDELLMTFDDTGAQLVFDHQAGSATRGLIVRQITRYGNEAAYSWDTINFDPPRMTQITVDNQDTGSTDWTIEYNYFSTGNNTGKMSDAVVHAGGPTASVTKRIDYTYDDDSNLDYSADVGTEGDLLLYTVKTRISTDTGSTLSKARTTLFRYYKAADADGGDHQVKHVFSPVTVQTIVDADTGIATASDILKKADSYLVGGTKKVEDYADTVVKYYASDFNTNQDLDPGPGTDNLESKYNPAADSNSHDETNCVSEVIVRSNCSSCGGGGHEGTFKYYYMARTDTGVNGIAKIVVENRPNGSRRIYGLNDMGHRIRDLFEDDFDGGSVSRWYVSYKLNTVADGSKYMISEYRAPSAHTISTVTDFFDPAKDSTMLNTTGLIHTYTYSSDGFATISRIKQGKSGTAYKVIEKVYGETLRPDLPTQVISYRTATTTPGDADKEIVNYSYTFYDTDKQQLKTQTIKAEGVPTSENGPGTTYEATVEEFYDDRGQVRWRRDGEGYVAYFGYDPETGIKTLQVVDVDTSSLPLTVDNDWDGTDYGYATDDSVPFSRTGTGTALDLETSWVVDDNARVTKVTDPEGVVTYTNYLDQETRVYPAWNAVTDKPILPLRIAKRDHAGRVTEAALADPAGITFTDPPDAGSTETNSISQADYVAWTTNTFNDNGQLTSTKRYHSIPTTGSGTLITNYYETLFQYDSAGDREYQIDIVADGTGSYEIEQVTKWTRDALDRVTQIEEGVSSDTHDMGSSYTTYPTLTVISKAFYDDPDSDSTPEHGVGDGNVSWTRKYYGSGDTNSILTRYLHDWRNRRVVTMNYDDTGAVGQAPHTLVKFDHHNRLVASAQYSSTTGLDAADDPTTLATNRLTLSETKYDQMGRVYQTVRWEINQSTGAKGIDLVTNNYYDRRSARVARTAPGKGAVEYKYDGARRNTETRWATSLETTKYASGAFDYLDANDKIVQIVETTFDAVGNATKSITKELNHNDTNGIGTTDFIRTYVYRWYDDANRLTDEVSYGTNNSSGWKDTATAPTYGASAPTRSDTALVTSYAYDGAGRRQTVKDAASVTTRYAYDDLGRTTQIDEADGTSVERITKNEYDGFGSLTKIKADLAGEFDSGHAGVDTQTTQYVYGSTQSRRWVTEIRYPTGHDAVGTSTADTIAYTYNVDGTVATRRDQNNSTTTYDYDDLRRKTAERVTTLGTGVDGAMRAITHTYTARGELEFVTSHSDSSPDTTTWTDAVNQVKYEYNGLGLVTKERLDADSKVGDNTGVDTRDTVYAYDLKGAASGNHARIETTTYPEGRKIWFGYTHTSPTSTFQDEINDAFDRVGQIAKDNAGAKGDILAEYDFNGLSRLVRRTQDDGTGWAGNDTRLELWGGTTGQYAGFDRFGRVSDLKQEDISGATNLARLKYGYDRVSNRKYVEDTLYSSLSKVYTYDSLHRLDRAKQGTLNSTKTDTPLSNLEVDWTLDDLGNWTALKTNQVTNNTTHTFNATNEIKTIDVNNESDSPLLLTDPFASENTSVWSEELGTFSVSAGQLQVDTLTSGYAADVVGGAHLNYVFLSAVVTFNSDSGKAGLIFAYEDTNNYWAAVLDATNDRIEIFQITSGTWTSKAQSSWTIVASTAYTVNVEVRSKFVEMHATDGTNERWRSANPSSPLPSGRAGVVSSVTSTKFDDFKLYDLTRMESVNRGLGSSAAVVINGDVDIDGLHHRGLTRPDVLWEDDIMMQLSVDFDIQGPQTYESWFIFRYQDPFNYYYLRFRELCCMFLPQLVLYRMEDGKATQLASAMWEVNPDPFTVRIKLAGQNVKAWVDSTQSNLRINHTVTGTTYADGGFGFYSEGPAWIDDIKIGYDNNGDDDISDAGDDIIYDENSGGTSVSPTYDDNGNLTEDAWYKYAYDAWNRLVKVSRRISDRTLGVYTYDATGRRIKKVVTNAGDHDGTEYYYYRNQQIIEVRDGSENVLQHMIYGTQYVDEPVALVSNPGVSESWYFHHADANYNVVMLTDANGLEAECYQYTPYGQTSTFDGNFYPISSSAMANPACYTGRQLDPETGLYYFRARQYQPSLGRFLQRDPLSVLDGSTSLTLFQLYAQNLAGDGLYVPMNGNPVSNLDPSGLITVSECYDINRMLRAGCARAALPCVSSVVGPLLFGAGCIAGCGITAINPISYGGCVAGCLCIDGLLIIIQFALCFDIVHECNKTAADQLRRCLAVAEPG